MEGANQEKMRACASLVDKSDRIVLVGHERADGDVIGTMMALYHRLVRGGKKVTPFLFEPVPPRYEFLGFQRFVKIFDASSTEHRAAVAEADAVFLLDASTEERLPGLNGILERKRGVLVRFDHHPSPDPIAVDIDITDEAAFATGQLVYEFFALQAVSLTREEALGLFVAIATDTGWFRYSNTVPGTLRMAAELLEAGIEPAGIYRSIYQTNDLGLIRLMGRVVSMIRSELDGRLLWAAVDLDLVREMGLKTEFDSDMLMDILRSSRNARCVALFRETADGSIRVNLRSKGEVIVNRVAEMFGGGGHRNAAGATINGSDLEISASRVVSALKNELARAEAEK